MKQRIGVFKSYNFKFLQNIFIEISVIYVYIYNYIYNYIYIYICISIYQCCYIAPSPSLLCSLGQTSHRSFHTPSHQSMARTTAPTPTWCTPRWQHRILIHFRFPLPLRWGQAWVSAKFTQKSQKPVKPLNLGHLRTFAVQSKDVKWKMVYGKFCCGNIMNRVSVSKLW